MPDKKNKQEYFEKAAAYDMMANYYKYLDPNLHINYYKKHLQYLNKALHLSRVQYASEVASRQPHAKIRFLHASTYAPNVDIYINAIKIFKNVPFKEVSAYLSLPAGKYHIDIYPTDNMVSTILNKRIAFEAGKSYTLPMIGVENKFRLLSYNDEPNVPHGETKVRFIHLSSNTPPVDIAVVKGDVVFPKISYKDATNYLGLSPMTVDLEMRESGTKQTILPLHNLQFKENEVYSIVAVGLHEGEPSIEMLILKG